MSNVYVYIYIYMTTQIAHITRVPRLVRSTLIFFNDPVLRCQFYRVSEIRAVAAFFSFFRMHSVCTGIRERSD